MALANACAPSERLSGVPHGAPHILRGYGFLPRLHRGEIVLTLRESASGFDGMGTREYSKSSHSLNPQPSCSGSALSSDQVIGMKPIDQALKKPSRARRYAVSACGWACASPANCVSAVMA